MAALGPVAGLPIAAVETTRTVQQMLGGSLGAGATLALTRLASSRALDASLAPSGLLTRPFVAKTLQAALALRGLLLRLRQRAALRFRGVKGIITKGNWS